MYHTSPTHVAHALSSWKPFSQRYVAISAETSSLEKHLASSANLRAAASIRALVQASASTFGGGDGGGVINVLRDGGRGGSADASSMGQGGLLFIKERATANNLAVRLARFFAPRSARALPRISVPSVFRPPAPAARLGGHRSVCARCTACAVIARLLRPAARLARSFTAPPTHCTVHLLPKRRQRRILDRL